MLLDVSQLHKIHPSTQLEALKLWKGLLGTELLQLNEEIAEQGIFIHSFFLRSFVRSKETTLERADFTLQLLMFVTTEKEGVVFIIFFFFQFLSAVVTAKFKLELAERVQAMKALNNRPRRQLFLM